MIVSHVFVSQSLEDSEQGVSYTVVFGEDDGNVNELVCNYYAPLSVSGAVCKSSTVMQGNVLSGYFYLGSSNPIPCNASAIEMKEA
jgi:hypothetical protein